MGYAHFSENVIDVTARILAAVICFHCVNKMIGEAHVFYVCVHVMFALRNKLLKSVHDLRFAFEIVCPCVT